MSATLLDEAAQLARDAAVRLCWTQWQAMGSMASAAGSSRANAIVDPEALILLSLYGQSEERRLTDMVVWWAEVGSGLTSLHRLRRVASRFPGRVGIDGLEFFARLAAKSGDRRWRKHASGPIPEWVRASKGPEQPTLTGSSALWPRLRAAFGVGAKADTLVFLLGLQGAWASAKTISFATGYSSVAVRKAAGEMALAHLIRETEGRPAEYVAPAKQWADLLELYPTNAGGHQAPRLPAWRFWSEVNAFLVGAIECARLGNRDQAPGSYVVASRARDLIEAHTRAFNFNGIAVPPLNAFRGLDMLEGLRETVQAVVTWMVDAV